MISPPPGNLDGGAWVHRKAAVDPARVTDGDATATIPAKHRVIQNDVEQHCVIVAACSQEPRLGRWMRIAGEGTGSRNQVLVWAVPYREQLATRRRL